MVQSQLQGRAQQFCKGRGYERSVPVGIQEANGGPTRPSFIERRRTISMDALFGRARVRAVPTKHAGAQTHGAESSLRCSGQFLGTLNRGNHKSHSRYFLNYLRKSPRGPCADLQLWQNSGSGVLVVEPSRSSSPFQAHFSVTAETTRENAANAERFRNGKRGVVRYQFSHVVGPQAHCPLAFSYRLGGIGEDGGTRGGGRARVR